MNIYDNPPDQVAKARELIQVSESEFKEIMHGRTRLARLLKVAAIVHAQRRVRARRDKARNRKADKVAKAARKRNR